MYFLLCLCPSRDIVSPLSVSPTLASPTTAGHLLQLMNLHWHILIIQRPAFIVRFTLGVVHLMGLSKCIMIYSYRYHTEYWCFFIMGYILIITTISLVIRCNSTSTTFQNGARYLILDHMPIIKSNQTPNTRASGNLWPKSKRKLLVQDERILTEEETLREGEFLLT